MCKEVKDPYGFIYVTTNLINGKRYIGQKKFDKNWKKYLGSGSHLQKAIKKYGKENFIRNIVDYAFTLEELNEKEKKWIENYNAVESDDYYNMIEGGDVTHSLKKKNSIPIICLNNGMIFNSIADAIMWSGHVELTIKKTFKQKFDSNNKKLIFRPANSKCLVCDKFFHKKSIRDKRCEDCRDLTKCQDCGKVVKKAKARKYCECCATKRERERVRKLRAKKKLNT